MNLLRKLIIVTPLIFTLQACFMEDKKPSLCPTGNCDAKLFLNAPLDENGYYHVDLDFSGENYPRFTIYVEADDVDPYYYYNDMGVVEAAFESDTYWYIQGGLTVQMPLYQPFTGYFSQAGNPISVGNIIVTLDWFDSYPVPVVQETTIYLKKYFAGSTTQPADEYTPSSLDRKWSKRIVGPFSPSIVGDTITVYAEIYWDGGSQSKSKIFEQKIIIE